MDRTGSAVWKGTFREGGGSVSSASGALKSVPYSAASRFEQAAGTNPEELIAAAHAGCFTMALAGRLAAEKLAADHMTTMATVTVEKVDGGFAITRVHLALEAKVPGADQATLERLADVAVKGCPVSKLLNAPITLESKLVG